MSVGSNLSARTSLRTRFVGPLVVPAVSLIAASAQAMTHEVPLRIDYDAPSGCPGAAAFIDQVRRAGATSSKANARESTVALDVKIEAAAEGRASGTSSLRGR